MRKWPYGGGGTSLEGNLSNEVIIDYTTSVHLKSAPIRGVAIGGSGLIRQGLYMYIFLATVSGIARNIFYIKVCFAYM